MKEQGLSEKLSKNLKKFRNEKGLSKRKLSIISGVSKDAITAMELRTRDNFRIKTIEKIGEALEIEPIELLK